MDEKDLDISMPDEASDSDAARREAIAQARAIRREAAAKEESEKQQAAAEANAILKSAESDPTVQRDFQDNTLSRLFGQLRTPVQSGHPAHRQSNETAAAEPDSDSIVAEIMAEVTANAVLETEKPVFTGRSSDPDTDALVEQIVAEMSTKKNSQSRADADALVDQIIAETAGRSGSRPDFSVEDILAENAAADEAEPEEDYRPDLYEEEIEPEEEPAVMSEEDALTAATDQAIADGEEGAIEAAVEQIAERAVQNAPKQEEPSAPEETPQPEPEKPVSEKKPDPLAAAFAAEEQFNRERRQAIDHSEEMEEAAEQYAEDTAEAKRTVKKLTRKTSRAWQREAARENAKRHLKKTKKVTAAVNFAVCSVLFFGIAIGMAVLERPTVSDEENRMLATMPAFNTEDYLSGKYTEGVSEYYNDTVPMRSTWKSIIGAFRQCFGIQSDMVLHGNAGADPAETEPAVTEPAVTTAPVDDPNMVVTTTQAAETTAPAQTEPEEQEEDGERLSNQILIYKKRAISLFQAGPAQGEAYAGYLNKYQEQLGSGVQVYSLVSPTACSFYTPDNFKSKIRSEEENINYINSCFVGVKPVDAYGALAKHTDEPIFMRTDHHWGSIGAFYAAEEFSKTARVPFARITDYEKVVKEGYVGTMYGYSGDKTIKDNPEEFIYYIPKAQFTTTFFNRSVQNGYEGNFFMNIDKASPVNWYLVYMSGDDHVVRLNTEVKNGRRLVIIKDSYGNALVPWLTSSFEQIDVIDMRYFNKNAISYIKEVGATDVLFAMNSFSANGGNAKKIEKIRTQ